MEKRLQGTDITVQLTLTDADGNPVEPNSLDDYRINVYQNELNKHSLITFAKNPSQGEEAIEVLNNNDGIIQIIIPRTWTKRARKGKVYCEMKVKLQASNSYVTSQSISGDSELEICEIIISSQPESLH